MPIVIGPECSFFIPLLRDSETSDGQPHTTEEWNWLQVELLDNGLSFTIAPGVYRGTWINPNSGAIINDESLRYIVALPEARVDELRTILKEACQQFAQQCICLSVAGQVETTEADHEPTP